MWYTFFSHCLITISLYITKDKYFLVGFQWGKNSDGKARNNKFKINKKILKEAKDDSFVIYRYRP